MLGWALNWGDWGTNIMKMGITVLTVLAMFGLVMCSIVPILKKMCCVSFALQMSEQAAKQVVEAQLAQLVVGRTDLFPIPDYGEVDDISVDLEHKV